MTMQSSSSVRINYLAIECHGMCTLTVLSFTLSSGAPDSRICSFKTQIHTEQPLRPGGEALQRTTNPNKTPTKIEGQASRLREHFVQYNGCPMRVLCMLRNDG